MASKNKGNKYFRGGRYELAIKCYTEAIDLCPKSNKSDLSTFYQNRAAAYEQMVRFDLTINILKGLMCDGFCPPNPPNTEIMLIYS